MLRDLPASLHELAEAMKSVRCHEMADALKQLPTKMEHHITASASVWLVLGFLAGAFCMWVVRKCITK